MSRPALRVVCSLICAAVVGCLMGVLVAHCSLLVRPDPYTPPPLVLQGTKPDPEDAGP